ncbi:hypothetical protein FF2_045875 [Malus domestica]
MPDAFTDLAKVRRSHIPATNALVRMDLLNVHSITTLEGRTVLEGGAAVPPPQLVTLAPSQSPAPTLKRGKPPSSKGSQPRKRKTSQCSNTSLNPTIAYSSVPTHKVILNYGDVLNETFWPPENHEILIHYVILDKVWNQNEMIVDYAFVYTFVSDVMLSNDIEPRFVDACQHTLNWSNWKQAI